MKPSKHSFWPAALALLLIMVSCQKDLLQDDAPVLDSFPLKTGSFYGHERSYVTFEELNSHLQGHEVYDRYAEKFENTDPGAYISGISRNRILKLENDSITTYTLNVITPNPDNRNFTNLVFVEKDGVLRRYFLRYTPGENWKNALLEGDMPSGYEGEISFVDDSGHAFSSIADYPATTESSWSDGCFSVIYSENTPCCGSFSCCPCTDRNGIDTLVIEIICPGGGGGGGSGGDPEDPNNDPWAGGAVIGSGGGPGGSGGLGNIGISTEPYFDFMLIYNLNALLQTPLTLEQENWIMADEENYQFAMEALDALQNGGEVDFDEKIIKDQTFLNTKANCVLEELINSGNNLFKIVSEAFTSQNSEFRIRFTTYNNPGDPADARTALPDENGIINIRFNLANSETMQAINIAATILHETIHAELHRIKLSNNAGPNSLPTDQYNWYVKMWEYYENIDDNINYIATSAEHYYMANYFINPIAEGLREYDNHSHPVDYYKFFAWDALSSYGLNAGYITQSELTNLANLSLIIHNDNYESPCDN